MNPLSLAFNLLLAGKKSSLQAFAFYAASLGAKQRAEVRKVLLALLGESTDPLLKSQAQDWARKALDMVQ